MSLSAGGTPHTHTPHPAPSGPGCSASICMSMAPKSQSLVLTFFLNSRPPLSISTCLSQAFLGECDLNTALHWDLPHCISSPVLL